MTVCIAALSTYVDAAGLQRKIIILAADRMITARRIREYEFADQTKAVWHRDNLALLMSGSVDELYEAYVRAFKRLTPDSSVEDVAKTLADEIQAVRRRGVERLLLEPYNLTLDGFIARQKEWMPDFFERVNSQITDSQMDLGEAIIAGFDTIDGNEMARIYTIEGTGWERAWSGTGFCAIGIGAEHAEAEFAHALYTPRTNWIEAMRITFFAKKRAEEAPGVGPNTDLWYMVNEGAMYFPPQSRVVQELGTMYDRTRLGERFAIGADAVRLNRVLVQQFDARTPRAATEKERESAEAEAEKGDTTVDAPDIRGNAVG